MNYLVGDIGNTLIKINFKRSSKKKKRLIKFYFKKSIEIFDWTDENNITLNKKKKILYRPRISVHNLQYQLYYFLKSSYPDLKKLPNSNYNLINFFKFIKQVKKINIK